MTEPTTEQLQDLLKICELTTGNSAPIHLMRMDERTGELFILAGENLEIFIDSRGRASYDLTTLEVDGKAELRDYILHNSDDEEALHNFSDMVRANAEPLNPYDLPEIIQRQN